MDPEIPRTTPAPDLSAFLGLFLPISYGATCALGLLGNVLVIVVFAFYEKKRKLMDAFLLNLAVADILFLCTLPFLIWTVLYGWTFGEVMCKIVMGIYRVNLYTSMLTLTAITCDRFASIYMVKAQKFHQYKQRCSGAICLLIWLIAFLFAIPQFKHFIVEKEVCKEDYEHPNTKLTLYSIQLVFGFFLPLTAMFFSYALILKTLIRVRSLQKRKSIRIILTVVVVFVVTQLPYNVSVVVFVIKDHDEDLVDVISILEAVAYFHACLNPVLYFFVATKFRNNFWKMLKDLRLAKGREEPSQESEGSSKAVSASTHMEAFSMVQAP